MWPSLLISYLQITIAQISAWKEVCICIPNKDTDNPRKIHWQDRPTRRCARIPLATPSKGGAKGCQKSWGLCWFYLNYFGFNDPFIFNCFLYKVMKFLKFKCYLFLVPYLLFFFTKKIKIYHLCVTIDSLIFLLCVNFFIKLR